MIEFDQNTQAMLENAYAGHDITRRRMANFAALDPQPGERILDLGCGQGLLTVSLARAVGSGGLVTGVDPSAEMRATAQRSTEAFQNIAIAEGDAGAIPLEDATQDRAVSVQVFEYVPDVPGALREMRRVLRPNGRLVIGDFQWDTLSWYSEDPDRMRTVLRAWDQHLHDPLLPARLSGLLRDAGFAHVQCTPLAFVDTCLRPDGLAALLLLLIKTYLRERALLPDREITAWAEEQHTLAEAGTFFFAFTQFIFSARRA